MLQPEKTGTNSSAISGSVATRRFQETPDRETPAAAGEVMDHQHAQAAERQAHPEQKPNR